MALRRTVLVIAALLLLVGGLPSQPAAAQRNTLPQDPLQLATEVGRYLFAYDEAANRATTMLLSEEVGTDAIETSIVRQHRDGHWTVGFGRLMDGGGFRLMHEVVMNDRRRIDSIDKGVGRRLGPNSFYARAARAQQLVRNDLEGEYAPYNLLVLPAGSETGHMTVYAVPAQTNPEAYRLGGDYRYEVDPSEGTVVSQTRLHKRLYEIGTLGQETTGSAHEAVRPVETDVLFATVRRPKAPHFVVSEQQVFRIAPDGTITKRPAGALEQRQEVKMFAGQ